VTAMQRCDVHFYVVILAKCTNYLHTLYDGVINDKNVTKHGIKLKIKITFNNYKHRIAIICCSIEIEEKISRELTV